VAVRPLCLEELAEVLAFDFDEPSGGIPQLNADWRREDQEDAVLSTCSSLVTVIDDNGERIVQFSHFSVKEFLTSDRLSGAVAGLSFHHIDLEPAHQTLAQACLGVLLLLDDSTEQTLVQRFPLFHYSALYWRYHALFSNVSLHIKDGLENLFVSAQPYLSRWILFSGMKDGSWEGADSSERVEEAIPMYYAALFGFHDIVEKLIGDHPEYMELWGGPNGTALHAAATNNRVKVVQSLLNHGADVNSLGPQRLTPLHIASQYGSLDVGQFLLEHGADVTAKKEDCWTALHLAASNGYLELVRMLLGHDADIIDVQNSFGWTPLSVATMLRRVFIVRFLLNSGADPNRSGKDRRTQLHWASNMGYSEVASVLLEGGADVNAEDDEGKTAYQIALKKGHDKIAQLLSGHAVEKT
jgi:ankyrin repeat protein